MFYLGYFRLSQLSKKDKSDGYSHPIAKLIIFLNIENIFNKKIFKDNSNRHSAHPTRMLSVN